MTDVSADRPVQRSCGTMDAHRRLLSQDPAYAAARAQIENYALRFQALGGTARAGVTHIPVVVHVVWNTAEQNVSDAQVQSQLTVLNQDFRRTNPDADQVPAAWQPLVADARVEFALATTDPAGNPTTGITRTETATASFGTDDAIKFAARGGADAWPADRYLNLWVGPLGGGLLGYAQFPGGPAATDGVVILHSGFGTTGTAAAPFDLGRTATHEIGHWFNLFHIWGDDGTGCSGTDQVDDTPNQGGPNFGRPGFPHLSCDNGPDGDMFVNYMDYTDDAGMFMFTAGQVVRVDATLDGPRASLLRSFVPVYAQGDPGNGIGGYDLASAADRVVTFDHDSSGKQDHLVLYRPGTGTLWILQNQGGKFSPVYAQGDPGTGIGGYDLASPADLVFPFDYEGSGKADHLALYRPGTGTFWILRNEGNNSFVPVYEQGDPGTGIGGYDLASPDDRAFAFDFSHSGKLDHLALYRPGTGTFWILRNRDGKFSPVYQQGDPGTGIGGYDLASPADQALAYDYDSSGKPDHLALYRPGTGTVWILKR